MNESQKIYKIYTITRYEAAVPRPTKDEYDALAESIRLRGQQVPIVVNPKGIVLDGHTRFEICNDLGIKPEFIVKKFDSEEEELQYVIEANLNRRQINTWQKLMCYQTLIDYWQGRVKKAKADNAYANKMRSIGEKVPYAQEVGSVAERFNKSLGIGINEMRNALFIYKRRLKHPVLIQQLETGALTINQAKKAIDKGDVTYVKKYEKRKTFLECPSCNKIHPSTEFKKLVQKNG